jgi:N-formylglutamate amidohydrolase
MFKLDHPQKNPIFDYYAPLGTEFRGLISIPHSGEIIPSEFISYLSSDERAYKEDVDFKVNELIDIKKIQEAGIGVLVAHVHRICVDLNRSENNSILFCKDNTQGKKLVIKDPAQDFIEEMITTYHRPYFEIMKAIIKDLEAKKSGLVSMIDLHSMPSKPTEYHMKQNPKQKTHRPDFCLSDRHGKTCRPEFIQFFHHDLTQSEYECTFNDPYIGGYVTEYVDQFRTNNIQIEINRSIYMDEDKKVLSDLKVEQLKPKLTATLIKGFEKFDT